MTPTTSAVRAACDAQPDERADVHCIYPRCTCVRIGFDAVLDTLLANARAEAAAGERDACAEVADMWATENFRLAGDTILTDRFLSGKEHTQAAFDQSMKLADEGAHYAARAHSAQDIAAAIRARAAKEAT